MKIQFNNITRVVYTSLLTCLYMGHGKYKEEGPKTRLQS